MTATLTTTAPKEPTVEETRLLKRGQIKALIDITKLSGQPYDRVIIRNNHLYLSGRYVIVECDLQSLSIFGEFDTPTFTSGSIHMDELKRWYGLEHGYLTVGDLQGFPREDEADEETKSALDSLERPLSLLSFEAKTVEDFEVAAWQLKLILRLLPNAATLLTTFRGNGLYRIIYGPWTVVGTEARINDEKDKEQKDDEETDDDDI